LLGWKKTKFLIIPLILSIGIAPNLSFGYFPDSPYDQQEQGIPIPEITCRADRILMVDLRGKPGCAFEEHVDRLVEFGWGKIV